MHNWFSPKAFALLAATLLAPALFTPAHAEVTPEVRQVYDRLANELTQHRAFAVDMTLEYTASVGEETQWLVTTYKVAYERPNRVAIKVENPHIQYDFYLENGLWTHYLPAVNQYVVQPAQMTAPELISRSGVGPIGDAMIIFMQIALAEPFKVPMQYALNSEYKGEVDVDGDLYDKVFLDFDAVKWDAWISKGDQPLLHRIVPQLPVVENHYMEQFQKHVELDVVMDFDNWNFNEEEVLEKLVFAERDSAEQIDSFEVPTSNDPEEALLGKPAPAFELTALDGSAFSLADKIGNEIVVLDFWATWCGPCRQAMPIIEKVTEEFAEQDVRLYAVNLQEDEATIKSFLESEGINVNVLLDTDAAVQRKYLAEAIPQTVIIGKDGIVQAVHVGVSPTLEDTLRQELGVLAEGGNLVAAK